MAAPAQGSGRGTLVRVVDLRWSSGCTAAVRPV